MYQSRQLRAAACRSSGVEGLGGPGPLILRLRSWRPSLAAPTTSSSWLGATRASIKRGDDVEVAGMGQCPGGDPANAWVAVGKHLAKPVLEGAQGLGTLFSNSARPSRRRPRRPARRGDLPGRRAFPRSRRSWAGSPRVRRRPSSTSDPWGARGRPAAFPRPAA